MRCDHVRSRFKNCFAKSSVAPMVASYITFATWSCGWTVIRPVQTTPFTMRVDTVLVFVDERIHTDITRVMSPYGIATELESTLRFWEMENKKFEITSKREDATDRKSVV